MITWNHFTQNSLDFTDTPLCLLQFPHRSVQHSSLQLLHCLLLRVKATLQACTKPHAMYTREQLGDMAQNLQDMLVKVRIME